MKTRNGFVSNSSSSSFVIIGYKLKYEDARKFIQNKYPEEYEKILNDAYEAEDIRSDLWNFLYDHCKDNEYASYLSDDGPGYIGKIISEAGDYGMIDGKLSAEEIKKAITNVQKELGFDELPSLIVGTRST